MFLLEFDHDSVREPSEKQAADLAATSEMNLRYGYFETRIFIAATGFEAEKDEIPLLDFVHCA
ncbi:hypothetical protein, partial [Streptomyces narbonensis]